MAHAFEGRFFCMPLAEILSGSCAMESPRSAVILLLILLASTPRLSQAQALAPAPSSMGTQPSTVAGSLAAKSGAAEVAPEAVAFDGPAGDGRRVGKRNSLEGGSVADPQRDHVEVPSAQ